MTNRVIIFEGTSFSANGFPIPPGGHYATPPALPYLGVTTPPNWALYSQLVGFSSGTTLLLNAAVGSSAVRIADGNDNSYEYRTPWVQAAMVPGTLNILSVEGHGVVATDSAQLGYFLAYCTTQKNYAVANGIDLRIIASTACPTGAPPGLGPDRQAVFNPGLRAAIGNQIDAVADWGSDPIMGPDAAPNNANLYNGGVHPTIYGPVYLANIFWRAYNTLNVSGSRDLRLA